MIPSASVPGRRSAEFALILSLLGLGVSIVLLREHLTVFAGDVAGGLFCGQAGRFDCNAVAAHHSSWLVGLPVAFWGILFYLTMAVLALDVRVLPPGERAAAASIGVVLAIAAVMFDAYLGIIMVTQIGAICLNCVATYAINVVLAVLFWRLDRSASEPRDWRGYALNWGPPAGAATEPPAAAPIASEITPEPPPPPVAGGTTPRPWAWKVGATFVALCGVVTALVVTARSIHETLADSRDEAIEFMQHYTTEPAIDMRRFDGHPSQGPPNARVTIAVASDFSCSFCRALAGRLDQLRAQYPNDVRVIFLNAPINSSCNPAIDRVVHEHACWLAKAAICANEHHLFWQYHDLIYRDIPPARVTPEYVRSRIASIGIEAAALEKCTQLPQADSALARDVELFQELGMKSVPSLVINGHVKEGGIYPSTLRAIVEVLVAQK